MQERRTHPRIKQVSPIDATILSSPARPDLENRTFTCATVDISAGGVQLRLPESVPVGGTLELRLDSENPSKTFWHIGRVAWARKNAAGDEYRVGVEFTGTPEETLRAWEKVLADKLERSHDEVA